MGNGGSSDVSSEAGHGRPADGFLRFLRELSLSAVVAGAVVSVGLMLREGRSTPRLLFYLFAIWILNRLQHYATAAAINIQRLGAWWLGRGWEQTRRSPFLALAPKQLEHDYAELTSSIHVFIGRNQQVTETPYPTLY